MMATASGEGLRRGIGAVFAAAGLAIGLLAVVAPAGAQTASSPAVAKRQVHAFNTNTALPANDRLAGVSCVSASFCVAVGEAEPNEPIPVRKALAERWDGRTWTVMHSVKGGQLLGVSCTSTTFCMAVGGTLAEQWNGRVWHTRPGLTGGMAKVSCVSRSFCMAVGSDRSGDAAALWNGSRWRDTKAVDLACVPDCGLFDVSCPSARNCVGVGFGASGDTEGDAATGEAWNGRNWRDIGTVTRPISPFMAGVSCTSASYCAAVGGYEQDGGPCSLCAMAGSWNGHAWRNISPPSVSGGLRGISCTSAGHCMAVGGALAMRLTGTSLQQLPLPAPGGAAGTFLAQVSCWQPSGCMAVGSYTSDDDSLTLAERWNGTRWQVRRTPSPADFTAGLSAVSCAGQAPCMAVGSFIDGSDVRRALAEQRAGRGWRNLPVPSPGAQVNVLNGVSCPAQGQCIAVGYFGTNGGPQALAERWDGTSWHLLSVPHPGRLSAVSCSAPDSCQAVGSALNSANGPEQAFAVFWNGQSWQNEPTPALGPMIRSNLAGIWCPAAKDCVAVGLATSLSRRTPHALAEAWNGTTWRLLPAPSPSAPSELSSVSCPRRGFCVAAGSYLHKLKPGSGIAPAPARPLVETWNGKAWKTLRALMPAGNFNGRLGGISCVSRSRCIAAGRSAAAPGHVRALAEAWNGTRWRLQPIPSPNRYYNELFGLSCTLASRCTAVGLSGVQRTFASGWNGTRWQTLPTVNP